MTSPQQKKANKAFSDAFSKAVYDPVPTRARTAKSENAEEAYMQDKKRFEQKFRLDTVGDFRKIIAANIEFYKALKRYFIFFERLPNGAYVEFAYMDGGVQANVQYNLEQVRAAEKKFILGMRNLYYYLRYRGAKSGTAADGLQTFSGSFRLLGPAINNKDRRPLAGWIQNENFNSSDPTVSQSVADFWQYLSEQVGVPKQDTLIYKGYGVAQIYDTLFYIAADVNKLKRKVDKKLLVQPSGIMSQVFGNMVSPYYTTTTIKNFKEVKTRYQQEQGDMSIFQAIYNDSQMTKKKNINQQGDGIIDNSKRFNSEAFEQYWIKTIVSVTTDKLSELINRGDGDANAIANDDGLREQIRKEFGAVKSYNDFLKERREQIAKLEKEQSRGPVFSAGS